MQYFSKIGGNVAAAVAAFTITAAMFVGYFAPVLSAPVPVVLA